MPFMSNMEINWLCIIIRHCMACCSDLVSYDIIPSVFVCVCLFHGSLYVL